MAESKGAFTKTLRKTGRLEAYHVVRNALGLYTSVMVGAQYLSTSAKLDKETLFPALHRVIHREPALRMSVVGSRTPVQSADYPAFVSCDVDDGVLDKICVFRDDIRWDEEDASGFTKLLEDEFEVEFNIDDIAMPLWRVVVCQDNTVLFFYHHAIGDGKSGVAFHAMLLEALNSPDTTPAPHQLIPSVEDCVDVRLSIGKVFSMILAVL